MVRTFKLSAAAAVSAIALMAAVSQAQASSFAIRSGQGAEGLGMAYAGAASGGIGLAGIAWNPAVITMFPGRTSNWNFTYLDATAKYEIDARTAGFAQAAGGVPLGTGDIGGAGAFIPASYSAWQLTDRLWVGISTGAPWGLRSKPDNQSYAGQIYGRSAKIRTLNVSPTIGYQVNDWLSVGAALQIQHFSTELKQAAALAALSPPTILKGQDTAVGFRLGLALKPWQGATIGIGYRSAMHHTLTGEFISPARLSPIVNPGVNRIKANINLPESVTFGFSQVINDQWQVHLGAEWTNWSRFRNIPVIATNFGLPFTSLNFQYDDSWYFSGGVEYRATRDLTLRAGIAYELSAVNDINRTVFISDNDRLWLSAGLSYQITPKLGLDLGYTFIHVNKASVNYGPGHPQFRAPVIFTAEAKPYINIVSAGITYRWDDPTVPIPAAPVVRKY